MKHQSREWNTLQLNYSSELWQFRSTITKEVPSDAVYCLATNMADGQLGRMAESPLSGRI
jgi:hypothetical protein